VSFNEEPASVILIERQPSLAQSLKKPVIEWKSKKQQRKQSSSHSSAVSKVSVKAKTWAPFHQANVANYVSIAPVKVAPKPETEVVETNN